MTPAERAARDRKQKIFVAVGGLVLVGLLAIQVPKLLGGSNSSATPAATATSDAFAATGSTPVPTRTLVSSDRVLSPQPGQLSSFSRFAGKDPFVQQVHFSNGTAASSGTAGKSSVKPEKKPASKPATKGFAVGAQPTASMTVISVNGARQALSPGVRFPAADPVFVLVAEQSKTKSVVVGIAGGAYASGSRTARLLVGTPLVLVNTTTGARYKLVLVAVGNGQAAGKSADKSASADSSKSPAAAQTP